MFSDQMSEFGQDEDTETIHSKKVVESWVVFQFLEHWHYKNTVWIWHFSCGYDSLSSSVCCWGLVVLHVVSLLLQILVLVIPRFYIALWLYVSQTKVPREPPWSPLSVLVFCLEFGEFVGWLELLQQISVRYWVPLEISIKMNWVTFWWHI